MARPTEPGRAERHRPLLERRRLDRARPRVGARRPRDLPRVRRRGRRLDRRVAGDPRAAGRRRSARGRHPRTQERRRVGGAQPGPGAVPRNLADLPRRRRHPDRGRRRRADAPDADDRRARRDRPADLGRRHADLGHQLLRHPRHPRTRPKVLASAPGLVYYASATGKAFHRSLVGDLRFEGRVLGDQPWTLRALLRAGDRIEVIADDVYVWLRQPTELSDPRSITATSRSTRPRQRRRGPGRDHGPRAGQRRGPADDRGSRRAAPVSRSTSSGCSGPTWACT